METITAATKPNYQPALTQRSEALEHLATIIEEGATFSDELLETIHRSIANQYEKDLSAIKASWVKAVLAAKAKADDDSCPFCDNGFQSWNRHIANGICFRCNGNGR
jgi:hypothetical protein